MTKEVPNPPSQFYEVSPAEVTSLQKVFRAKLRRDIQLYGTEKAFSRWHEFSAYLQTESWWPYVVRTVDEVFQEAREELFHFIHPSVDSSQEWVIHYHVKRLVARHGLQEICLFLKQMADDQKILLPVSPHAAYVELIRMGMPSGAGFNEKTFQKHYKR